MDRRDVDRPHPHEPSAATTDAVDRRVGRTLMRYAAGFVGLALLAAALLFRSWSVFTIGLIFAFAFMLMISAPLWLAHSAEIKDEEDAHEHGLSRDEIDKP